jgi:hypothetical protein
MNNIMRTLFGVTYLASLLFSLAAMGETPPSPPAPPQPATAKPPAATPPAQPASTTPSAPVAESPSLAALAWLRGCWAGKVQRREFTEHWQPARGGMMLGFSQMVVREETRDYTYLRIESRPDGLYYVAIPSGKKELAFKLASIEDDKGVKVFTFTHSGEEFPQRIVYRQNEQSSMFAQVGGKVSGSDKEVTYPMHRVDCLTGATPRD